MNTNNASSFFQSAEAQEKFKRQAAQSLNELGGPIRLSTKLLYVTRDLDDDAYILLAESGSIARRLEYATGKTVAIYRGHAAPVTSIVDLGDGRIATSSWDKTIRIFDKETRECTGVLEGHFDFVKCLLHLKDQNILLSGSSDSQIRAWSTTTLSCLYTLKGHARGVETLAQGPKYVYSGGSESSIRQWDIQGTHGTEVSEAAAWIHDTSVYALHYDAESESLWTASADKTARQLSVEPAQSDTTVEKGDVLRSEASFEHPDYVRDCLLFRNEWLITACRDEQIRIWEIGSGALIYTLQGHYSEVSSLCIIGTVLISCSLDATVRKWTLTRQGLEAHLREQETWMRKVQEGADLEKAKETKSENGMTAEELAELEELMADD